MPFDAKKIAASILDAERRKILKEPCKCKLLVKACQSGKTGEAIRDWIMEQAKSEATAHAKVRKLAIFVCDNSLLLTQQTGSRIAADVEIKGNTVTLSSKADYKHIDKLSKTIMANKNISTIICCGNSRRFRDITELSNTLIRSTDIYRLSVYLDEADKILGSKNTKAEIDKWRCQMSCIKNIIFITATPYESKSDNLVKSFGSLELLNIGTVTSPDYHRLSDCELIDTSEITISSNVDYCADVFEKFIPEGPKIGDVYFIPAQHERETHDEMEKLLLDIGFDCVVKINGYKKEFTIKTGEDEFKKIPFASYDEVSKYLGNFYSVNNGKDNWAMAITGNICISRGISIQSPECFISHAIYGPLCASNYKNLYQIFARVCGNIRKFPGYLENGSPKIYTTKKKFDCVCKMEKFAIDLSVLSSLKSKTPIVLDKTMINDMFN